mgnify:CR=1 FL=1
MSKTHQREIVIGIVFLCLGASLCIPMEKTRQLTEYRTNKVNKIMERKYKWKTHRLRVYTDIIYTPKDK